MAPPKVAKTVLPRQSKLDTGLGLLRTRRTTDKENKEKEKKVDFREKEKDEDWGEEIEKMKRQIKTLESNAKLESEKRGELELKIVQLEERVEDLENEAEDMWGRIEYEERRSEAGSVRSRSSVESRMSVEANLSEGDMKMLKSVARKAITDERKNNIVIRGARGLDENELAKSVEDYLERKLEVKVKLKEAWTSGRVVIAKLGSDEDKRAVMENKSKLKETNVYIDNDLSREDRARQSDINRWAKERREKGEQVKIRIGKMYCDGRWKDWETLKAEEEKKKEEERMRDRERNRGSERNRIRERNQDRERSRERNHGRERSRERSQERERSRERNEGRERSRVRERSQRMKYNDEANSRDKGFQ